MKPVAAIQSDLLVRAKWPGRGGAVAVQLGRWTLVMGGADRAGRHYDDVAAFDIGSTDDAAHIVAPESEGVKLPEAGGLAGAAVALPAGGPGGGALALLFGGINFVDEKVYNSLYEVQFSFGGGGALSAYRALDCSPPVGTPEGRTGHALLQLPFAPCPCAPVAAAAAPLLFLLFGGSSPYTGALNDLWLLVARPRVGASAQSTDHTSPAAVAAAATPAFSYSWTALSTTGPVPEPRELFSAFVRPACCPATIGVADALAAGGSGGGGGGLPRVGCSACFLAPAIRRAAAAAAAADAPPSTSSTPTALGRCDCACDSGTAWEPPALVVVGGRNGDGRAQRDLCALDLGSLRWLPPVRMAHAVISAAAGTVAVAAAETASAAADAAPVLPLPPLPAALGFIHAVYGGWDGGTGLSSRAAVLDTRPLLPPQPPPGDVAVAAAVAAAAVGAAGHISAAPPRRAALSPGAWPWRELAVEAAVGVAAAAATAAGVGGAAAPFPTPRFAAAAVMLPAPPPRAPVPLHPDAEAGGGSGGEAAAAGAAFGAAALLVVAGGMEVNRDCDALLLLRVPPPPP